MARNDYYTIKPLGENGWNVLKVTADFEPAGGYTVSDSSNHLECDCFAGNKHTCRHRDMVRMYKSSAEFRQKIDNGAKYNFDKDKWLEPVQQ
jgi:hypothetical protein